MLASLRVFQGIAAVALFARILGGESAWAQLDPGKLEPEGRLKLFQASVADYQIVVEGDSEALKLREQPLMRFGNDVGGVVDGAVMLWTSKARPLVAAQVFVLQDGIWLHEFQSFADRPLALNSGGKTLWQPKTAGGKWQRLARAPAVEASRIGRLRQMKEMAATFAVAEDFRARASDKDTTRYELRLLPTPLHRYEELDNNIDGAVFAFVHGTDPEALLTIELQRRDENSTVQFAFAALTCWGLQAKQDGKEVWSVPEMYGKSARDQPYHIWRVVPDASVLKK